MSACLPCERRRPTSWCCLGQPCHAQAVHLNDDIAVCAGLLCLPSGTPLPLINGNFTDDSGEGSDGIPFESPLGWTVTPATDGGADYSYGPEYLYGSVVGFNFGATENDDDVLSQNITVGQGCRYQVLYTLTSNSESTSEFHPTVNDSPLLDAEGGSLVEVDVPPFNTTNYVGVFTAEADLLTLSFAGRNQDSYLTLSDVEVLAL